MAFPFIIRQLHRKSDLISCLSLSYHSNAFLGYCSFVVLLFLEFAHPTNNKLSFKHQKFTTSPTLPSLLFLLFPPPKLYKYVQFVRVCSRVTDFQTLPILSVWAPRKAEIDTLFGRESLLAFCCSATWQWLLNYFQQSASLLINFLISLFISSHLLQSKTTTCIPNFKLARTISQPQLNF